jgi:hypothetical protein
MRQTRGQTALVLVVALLGARAPRSRAGMFSASGTSAKGLESLFGPGAGSEGGALGGAQAEALGEHPAAKAGLESLFGAPGAIAATPPPPDRPDEDVNQAMGLGGAGGQASSSAAPGGGMSYLRDSEKKFMLSANGVNAGFPPRKALDKGQPAVRYTMEIPDAPAPSPLSESSEQRRVLGSTGSEGGGKAAAVPEEDASTSPSSEPKVDRLVAEQQNWWGRLKSGGGV